MAERLSWRQLAYLMQFEDLTVVLEPPLVSWQCFYSNSAVLGNLKSHKKFTYLQPDLQCISYFPLISNSVGSCG